MAQKSGSYEQREFPARALRDYDAGNLYRNERLQVRQGDHLRWLEGKEVDGFMLVALIDRDQDDYGKKKGWLPKSNLQIGLRPIGNYELLGLEAKTAKIEANVPNSLASFTVAFTNCLANFFETLREEQNRESGKFLLPLGHIASTAMEDTEQAANSVWEGMPATIQPIFQRGMPSVAQLMHRSILSINESTPGKGIYGIIYEDRHGEHHLYVGQTRRHFGQRYKEHRHNINQGQAQYSAHYRVAREAVAHKMFILTYLHNPALFAPTEQAFISFMHSVAPALLRDHIPTEYLAVAEIQTYLLEVAQVTAERTGWRVPAAFPMRGCNWAAPITVPEEQQMFYCYKIKNGTTLWRSNKTHYIYIGTQEHHRLMNMRLFSMTMAVCEPSDDITKAPAQGQAVAVVVELAPPGERHFQAFSRESRFGSFSDWDILERLAIRVEWQAPDAKLYCTYLQCIRQDWNRHLPKPTEGVGAEFVTPNYIRTMRIYDRLNQIQYPPNIPNWRRFNDRFTRGSRMMIVDLITDFMTQTLLVSPRMASDGDILSNWSVNSVQENDEAIQRAFPGVWIGKRNPFFGRHDCDVCYKLGRSCQQHSDGMCKTCYQYRHSCTWTDTFLMSRQGWSELGLQPLGWWRPIPLPITKSRQLEYGSFQTAPGAPGQGSSSVSGGDEGIMWELEWQREGIMMPMLHETKLKSVSHLFDTEPDIEPLGIGEDLPPDHPQAM